MLVTVDIPESRLPFMMELLKNLDFIPKCEIMKDIRMNSMEHGKFEINEKPSDFAGIWKDEKRDLKQLRASAWKQKS
jgi:hypothetical protein